MRNVKKGIVVPVNSHGTCFWKVNGSYFSDGDGNYLSMEGSVGNLEVEAKMAKAANYWLGSNNGVATWIPGARKISDDEYDDQMERLLDGKIPDPVDEIHQIMQRKK